ARFPTLVQRGDEAGIVVGPVFAEQEHEAGGPAQAGAALVDLRDVAPALRHAAPQLVARNVAECTQKEVGLVPGLTLAAERSWLAKSWQRHCIPPAGVAVQLMSTVGKPRTMVPPC